MRSSRAARSSSRTRSAFGTSTCRLFRGGLVLLFGRLLGPVFSGARLELEPDLAVGLLHQERLELPVLLRHEPGQEVGAPGLEQLLHLRALDRLLQDETAGAEVARPFRPDGVLADIGDAVLEDACLALGALAQGLLA